MEYSWDIRLLKKYSVFIKRIFKNPLTVWASRLLRAYTIEFKSLKLSLKIGYMTHVKGCKFGFKNTLYNHVVLTDVAMGDFSYVANDTEINRTKIGKFCSIGPNCKIGLGSHPISNFVSTHPIFYSTLKQSQVTFTGENYFNEHSRVSIGNDVWVGANSLILAGITIGDGAIVAAGAVVTEDIPPYAVVGGIPAKIIKFRFEESQIRALLHIQWWNFNIEYLRSHFEGFHEIDTFLNLEDFPI